MSSRTLGLTDLAAPLIWATTPTVVRQTVTAVAERLADAQTGMVDQAGNYRHGVTDEAAVIGMLRQHHRALIAAKAWNDAAAVMAAIERIEMLPAVRPKKGAI